MNATNEMKMYFESRAENEGFARVVVGSFFSQLNPTLEEISDVKTAVSEAVTNAIIHGYNEEIHMIELECKLYSDISSLEIAITDKGCGISDINQAMVPMFSTKTEFERAGMGFTFMEAFMDGVEVESTLGLGTCIRMKKKVRKESEAEETWIKQSL